MKYRLYENDCMAIMPQLPDNSVDFTLTDIPYDEVNRDSNGLRNLDKGGRMSLHSIYCNS